MSMPEQIEQLKKDVKKLEEDRENFEKAHEQFIEAILERLAKCRESADDMAVTHAVEIAKKLHSKDEKEVNGRNISYTFFTNYRTKAETFDNAIIEIRTELSSWRQRNWKAK